MDPEVNPARYVPVQIEAVVDAFRAWLKDNANSQRAEFVFTILDGAAGTMRARHTEEAYFRQARPDPPVE